MFRPSKDAYTMVKDCLEQLRQRYKLITFPPASSHELGRLNKFFQISTTSNIPDGYYEFLSITDGLICNGLEFFGAAPHERLEKRYTFPDVESVNIRFMKYNFFAKKVIIGQISEGLIYYDHKNRCYAISDRINLRSHTEINTFSELLNSIVAKF